MLKGWGALSQNRIRRKSEPVSRDTSYVGVGLFLAYISVFGVGFRMRKVAHLHEAFRGMGSG